MRLVPNSYQKPNLYTDKLMRYLTGDEWKTLDYALRRTFGFQRDRDRISVTQFMNGNGHRDADGNLVEFGTGLSRQAQVKAIGELMRFGVLIELGPDSRKRGRLWMLQLDEAEIRFDLLVERIGLQQERGRSRTAAARRAQQDAQLIDIGLSSRPMGSVSEADQYRSAGQTNTGQSDRPISVCGTDSQKLRGNKEKETQTETQAGASDPAITMAWQMLINFCDGDEQTAADLWRLQEKFAAVTQLKRPDPATDAGREKLAHEWWPHLRQVLTEADNELEAAEAAMQEAFQSMTERPKPLTVSGPRSIVNVTAGVLAGKRRNPNSGQMQQRPKGFAGIEAYSSRRGLTNDS